MPPSPYRFMVFVCTNDRPPNHPKGSCTARGSPELFQNLREELENNLINDVRVVQSGCLGPCEVGAVIVVYGRDNQNIDGTWYKQVTPQHVKEIVDSHLINGKPVEDLVYNWEPPAPVSGGFSIEL